MHVPQSVPPVRPQDPARTPRPNRVELPGGRSGWSWLKARFDTK